MAASPSLRMMLAGTVVSVAACARNNPGFGTCISIRGSTHVEQRAGQLVFMAHNTDAGSGLGREYWLCLTTSVLPA